MWFFDSSQTLICWWGWPQCNSRCYPACVCSYIASYAAYNHNYTIHAYWFFVSIQIWHYIELTEGQNPWNNLTDDDSTSYYMHCGIVQLTICEKGPFPSYTADGICDSECFYNWKLMYLAMYIVSYIVIYWILTAVTHHNFM